jgi:hypothetical protein
MDLGDSHDLHRDICRVFAGIALHAGPASLTAAGLRNSLIFMHMSQSSKAADTRWYLGVHCRKCKTPILFGLDRGEGQAPTVAPRKLLLTCGKAECRHQADYSESRVDRFQRPVETGKRSHA